jgi:hypothetical protein
LPIQNVIDHNGDGGWMEDFFHAALCGPYPRVAYQPVISQTPGRVCLEVVKHFGCGRMGINRDVNVIRPDIEGEQSPLPKHANLTNRGVNRIAHGVRQDDRRLFQLPEPTLPQQWIRDKQAIVFVVREPLVAVQPGSVCRERQMIRNNEHAAVLEK